MRPVGTILRCLAIVATATLALALAGCNQFEPRDKRFYYRALWNFSLREDLAELDSEFNGVDFGHSNLYENLLLTGGQDVSAIEDRARKETLAFIATKPRLNPNEEAIAPTYMKLAWRAQNTFDEAHALHRATYDIAVSDEPDKDRAIRNVLAYYKESAYAITSKQLDHHRLDSFPYSGSGSRFSTPPSGRTIICRSRYTIRCWRLATWPPRLTQCAPFSRPIAGISTSRPWNGRLCR